MRLQLPVIRPSVCKRNDRHNQCHQQAYPVLFYQVMDAVQHGQIRHNTNQRDQELNHNSLCTEDLHRQQEEQSVVAVDARRQLLIGDAVSHIVDAFQIRLTVVRVSLKRIDDPYAQEVHHCRKAVAAPSHPLWAVPARQQQIDCRHKKEHRKQVIHRNKLWRRQ